MIRDAINSFARALARLRARTNDRTAAVDLSEESFFAGVKRSPGLQGAITAFDEGRHPDAIRSAVRYFHERHNPKFFIGRNELDELVAEFRSSYPLEVEGLRNWAKRNLYDGYDIYERTTLGLSAGFSWNQLEGATGSDILYPVRPHRFAFAPKLALAELLGVPTVEELQRIVESWIRHASSHQSYAYASTLVVLQRLLAVHWTFCLLATHPSAVALRLCFDLLRILRCDAGFIRQHAGESVPNNHLLADGFAEWYVRNQFPEFDASHPHETPSDVLWQRELTRQFHEDGSSFEHSSHYHESGCEMIAAYLLLAERNNLDVPSRVYAQARRMLHFQYYVSGAWGMPVTLGDGTEDTLFPLSSRDGPDPSSLEALRRRFFPEDASPLASEGVGGARAFWLLGKGTIRVDRPPSSKPPHDGFFPDGGYFFSSEARGDLRLCFRTGPAPAENAFAGHMHGDMLSICLSKGEEPVFVDAGTYTYASADPDMLSWREFFQGRGSHNAVLLYGLDPLGSIRGSFRERETGLRVRSTWSGDQSTLCWIRGEIVGETPYATLVRSVVQVAGQYIAIVDRVADPLPSAGALVQFQTAAQTRVEEPDGSSLLLKTGSGELRLFFAGVSLPTIAAGQECPRAGWVSPRYGVVEPSPAIRFPVSQVRPCFVLSTDDVVSGQIETESGDDWVGIRIGGDRLFDCLLLNERPPNEEISAWNLRFVGRLLWARFLDGRLNSLRWLDGSFFASEQQELSTKHDREPLVSAEIHADGPNFTIGEEGNLKWRD